MVYGILVSKMTKISWQKILLKLPSSGATGHFPSAVKTILIYLFFAKTLWNIKHFPCNFMRIKLADSPSLRMPLSRPIAFVTRQMCKQE